MNALPLSFEISNVSSLLSLTRVSLCDALPPYCLQHVFSDFPLSCLHLFCTSFCRLFCCLSILLLISSFKYSYLYFLLSNLVFQGGYYQLFPTVFLFTLWYLTFLPMYWLSSLYSI